MRISVFIFVFIIANLLPGLIQASQLNDEFDSNTTLTTWQNLQLVEGLSPQLEQFNINDSTAGHMTMIPFTTTWYQEYKGPFLFKNVTGDFIVTLEVSATNRTGDGIPSAAYSLAGVMLRSPRNIINGLSDWTPFGENYVFLSLGRAGAFGATPAGTTAPHLEVKTTINSVSNLEIRNVNISGSILLRLARVGDYIICMYQRPGEDWIVTQRYNRSDFPDTLQIGMVTYTDYTKTSTYNPQYQMSHTLNANLLDDESTNSNLAFNPDLIGTFNFVRFDTVNLPQTLSNADLTSNAVTDEQLLSFLALPSIGTGENNHTLTVSSGVGGGLYQPGAAVDIFANPPTGNYIFSGWEGDIQHINDPAAQTATVIIPNEDITLAATYQINSMACSSSHLPISNGSRLVIVGNSFIGGNLGSLCGYIEQATLNSNPPFAINARCDVMYGNPLNTMYDNEVIADASSGNYEIGVFISGNISSMMAFDSLYQDNCMASAVLMTWESLNPLPIGTGNGAVGLEAYRAGLIEIAQRMRTMEAQTDVVVIPYGLVLYELTVNPPPSLQHLPLDYLYEPDGNIHDNAFGFLIKSYTTLAALTEQSPVGINFNYGPVQGATINTLSTQNIVLDETVRTEIQQRVWELVQQWNAGVELENLFSPIESAAQAPVANDVIDVNETTNTNPSIGYQYLRTEITELTGDGTLHLGEIEWLDANNTVLTPALTSNQSSGVNVTTNYPFASNAYLPFDNNITTNYYLNNANGTLPIHITLNVGSVTQPASARITRPMWSTNLNSLRFLGSNDGINWDLLLETNSASSDFINNGAVDHATYGFTMATPLPIASNNLIVENGTGDGEYNVGDTISLTADAPPSGEIFQAWIGDTSFITDINSANTTLLMPDQVVTITATYTPIVATIDTSYQYLRFEITEIIGDGTLHLGEVEWLDASNNVLTPSLTSNLSNNISVSSNYPAGLNAYLPFDGDISTNYYLNSVNAILPINITLALNNAVTPVAINITRPMWNDNLNGFRCYGSSNGVNWELLYESNNANSDFVNHGATDQATYSFASQN